MAPSKPAEPTLQGIPPELRAIIYKYAATNDEKRIVLGRKLVKEPHNTLDSHNLDIADRFFSAVAQHPLSMTCRQIRAEFLPQFQTLFSQTPGQSYDLIVNNFDLEQLAVGTICKATLDCMRVPMTLRCQMDSDIVNSVEAMRQAFSLSNYDYPTNALPVPRNMNFLVLLNYRNHWSGDLIKSKTMSRGRARWVKGVVADLRARMDTSDHWKFLRLFQRFEKLLDCRVFQK